MVPRPLKIAFIHPDLGIGGAERLVVDAALGLQARGHSVDLYTSHHDPNHCFEETKDGTLCVHHVIPPFPRSLKGKFHILFAHARQLHLTFHLLANSAPRYDIYFVDQLSTCIPFLRMFNSTRVVFYCHFPDKLLAHGTFVEGGANGKHQPRLLKRLYRFPMDWLEETTSRQADIILANSQFTARVTKSYFKSINQTLRVVYPGINISAYESAVDYESPENATVISDVPTLLSLNRFESKKNAALAVKAFSALRSRIPSLAGLRGSRLVLAGGFDPRLEDNVTTFHSLIKLTTSLSLTYNVIAPSSNDKVLELLPPNVTPENPDVLFVLNFTTSQRTALLSHPSTLALLYTPTNEHFGIGPVEAMICGLPVIACDSGGPTESVLDDQTEQRTGWLRPPDPESWADALLEIVSMSNVERQALSTRAKTRAKSLFGMDAMASNIEDALVDAADMGPVDGLASNTWLVIVLGFLVAYLLGPILF